MDPELAKLLGTGSITAALIALIFFVGKSLIAEIKSLREDFKDHSKTELDHHADVKEEVVGLRERLDALLDVTHVTPIEGSKRPRTNPHGVPTSYYGPRRPGTKDGG